MNLFSTSSDNPSYITNKLLEFSEKINHTQDKEKVVGCLLSFLFDNRNDSLVGSVGIFSRKAGDPKHLAVFIKGIKEPQKETESKHELFRRGLESADCEVVIKNRQTASPYEQKLFHPKMTAYLQVPVLSGTTSYGLLKIDLLQSIESLQEQDQVILQLALRQLANRLEGLTYHQLLIERNAERFFDKTLLALRDEDSEEVLSVLHQQLNELRESNPTPLLPVSWRFYYSDNERLKCLRLKANSNFSNKFVDESYYEKKSHIWHFMESKKESYMYTTDEIKSLGLTAFNGQSQASLCIRTKLKINQVPQWGRSDAAVYVVLWTDHENLFDRHLLRYQALINELVRHIKNKPRISPRVDDSSIKKTGEIINQMFGIQNIKALQKFLVEQAKILVPGVEMASYGQINKSSKNHPLVNMHAATEGCQNSYQKFPHPIKNEGLWQRLWETQGTTVVNNNYEKVRIKTTPIDNPHSAIVIPVFNDKDIYGILSLYSTQENIFSREKIELLQWLVNGFSGKLREISKVSSNEPSGSEESREIQAIQALIDLFTGDEAELNATPENVESLVKTAVKQIILHTDHSCWGLFEGNDNRYRLLDSSGLKKESETLGKLEFTPVADILREEKREWLLGSLRSDTRFTKLLPLLPVAVNSCLALPIHIKDYQHIDKADIDKPRSEAHILTLFLFHYHQDKFNSSDLEFLKVTLSLLEALMRQHAFQQEIDRITPLVFSGEVAASIAHEIKNPCQPLLSFINTMERAWQESLWTKTEFSKDMKNRIDGANKSLNQINENIIKLIKLSDITHTTLESVSITAMLSSVMDYQWYGDDETISIEESPIKIVLDPSPSELPAINFDKFHLSTILTNLIKNAVQAIEGSNKQNGEIHIGVKLHTGDKKKGNKTTRHREQTQSKLKNDIRLSMIHPLEIYIRDDGPGISADVKRRMFLPFETTKITGTGLGCYICRRMMKKIDGDIIVNSTLGQGATLSLLFHKDCLIEEFKHEQ